MIITTWTVPSVDLLGRGSADVRTGNVAAPAAPAAPSQGTGVFTGTVAGGPRRGRPDAMERLTAGTHLPQHNGTPLGIHRPGAPQS